MIVQLVAVALTRTHTCTDAHRVFISGHCMVAQRKVDDVVVVIDYYLLLQLIRQSNTFGITNNTHENTHENSATRIAAATCAAGRYSSCPRVKAEHPDGQCEAEPPGK